MAKGNNAGAIWLVIIIAAAVVSQFSGRAPPQTHAPVSTHVEYAPTKTASTLRQSSPPAKTVVPDQVASADVATEVQSPATVQNDPPPSLSTSLGEGFLYRVTATTLNVRDNPGTSANVITTLDKGKVIVAVALADGWTLVSLGAERFGWANTDFLEPTFTTRGATVASEVAPAPARSLPEPKPSLLQDNPDPAAASAQPLRSAMVGTCDCPYDLKSNGARCGGNSAYLNTGGRSPACYVGEQAKAPPTAFKPSCAENGSCFGDISVATGKPKTVYVSGYTRKDGTYVRGHYRSK